MQPAIIRGVPKMKSGFPAWWHHHGIKMKIVEMRQPERFLVIAGSAAEVTIEPAWQPLTDGEGWVVSWKITHHVAYNETTHGRRHFDNDELGAAFGLNQKSDYSERWILDQYGADSAEQGKYIRWKDFLNIPCPGTGHDGDPNISIEITEEIRTAVRTLIG